MDRLTENPGAGAAPLALQFQLTVGADIPSYYVNYVNVSHSPYDFTLTATKIPSPILPEQIEAAKSGRPIQLEAPLQIIVPPALMDGLIKTLNEQRRLYAQEISNQGVFDDKQH